MEDTDTLAYPPHATDLPPASHLMNHATLLSHLGHELRGPLTAVNGLAKIMLRAAAEGRDDPDRRARQLNLIRSGVDDMLRVVEQVVAIANLERIQASDAQVGATARRFDCRTILAEAVATVRPRAEERGQRIVITAPSYEILVQGDPEALDRVFVEVLDNAVKYTAGKQIHAAVTAPARQGPSVTISDDGPAIDLAERERIFGPFERGAAAERESTPGSGLGLYLADRLISMSGGTLHLSVADDGTNAFTVELDPAAASPANAP